jgi:predicted esterase
MASAPSNATGLLARARIIPPRIAHRSTVVFLHGLGDSSDGFRGLFEDLSLPYTRIVLPNAPSQPVTVNGGMRMQSWYDIHSLDKRNPINTREDRQGILKSRDALNDLLTSEAALVGGADRIVMGGFSQGAAMSLITGLSSQHRLAGIIALSGYLLIRDDYPAIMSPHAKEVPIFAYHGKQDQTIPYDIAVLSFDKLKALGAQVDFQSESGLGHGVSEGEVEKVVAFIDARLGAKGEVRKDL